MQVNTAADNAFGHFILSFWTAVGFCIWQDARIFPAQGTAVVSIVVHSDRSGNSVVRSTAVVPGIGYSSGGGSYILLM